MTSFSKIAASAVAAPLVGVSLITSLLLSRKRRNRGDSRPVTLSYSQVAWEGVWQRPQEFAQYMSQEIPTIYCAPVQLHEWLFTLKKRWKLVDHRADRELIVLSPLIFSGHYKNRLIFSLNCAIVAMHLNAWLGAASRVHCVINTPFGEPVVARLFFTGLGRQPRLRRLIYDLIDDFAAFDWAPSFARELNTRLIRRADLLFTGTYELYEGVKATHPDSEFIPCGVDFVLFNTCDAPPPSDIASLPGPIIGYFGSISDRLDMELIGKVAAAFPQASVVIIGPIHLAPGELPQAPNLHYLGLRKHKDLPSYAHAFTVGLIPFKVNDATVKLNPVKTLEYLAAGLPVVSTAIPDVQRFFSHVVHVAQTHDEYIQHVAAALGEACEERGAQGIEMARNASWATMSERMKRKLMVDARTGIQQMRAGEVSPVYRPTREAE